MFSGRTPADLAPNRLAKALAARRAAGLPVADLTVSNPTAAGIAYPEDEILAALSDPRSLRYAPDPRGLAEARQAVAAWHARQGYAADPERLLLAGSTSEAYGWLFKLLCEPGAEVLVPRPSYPLFECLATLEAVRTVQYPLDEHREWAPDRDALAALAGEATRALVLVNPNNPTGSYLKKADWEWLQEFAARRGLAVLSDEVFFDYPFADDARRVSSLAAPHEALTFTLSGLSKIAGLPQMKLGWIHVSGPSGLAAEALARLEWIADAYLPVSAPVQHAAGRWLALAPGIQQAILDRTSAGLAGLRAAIPAESGWRVLPLEGGWSATVEVPRVRSEEDWVLHLLETQGLLLQPGFFYDFERDGLLVASLLAEAVGQIRPV